MNPKDYLSRYRAAWNAVQSLSRHVQRLQEECDNLRKRNGERVRLDAAVASLMDAKSEIERETERMKLVQQEIISVIERVPSTTNRTLLRLVYIEGLSLVDASEKMGYSYRNITRIHGHALQSVWRILSES